MSPSSAAQSLPLPAPSKSGWIVLFVVSTLMALGSGFVLVRGVAPAPEAVGMPRALLNFG